MEDVPHYDVEGELEPRRESAAFNRPTKGTSVEKFREMVLNHLKVRARYFTLGAVRLKTNLKNTRTRFGNRCIHEIVISFPIINILT